jgi:Fic family protein/molecular chaperone DnaK (HSP70)
MVTEELIPLTKQRIPTIVGYDAPSNTYTIGEAARQAGLNSKTNVFNFKPAFGAGDKEFSSNKPYWVLVPSERGRSPYQTFSAEEAARRFLRALFGTIQMPEKVIVGEPGVRDQTWGENFRRHMREVFSSLELGQPEFFPEPFAVFQYYRHVANVFPVAKQAEIVLIIDIGGGTFNSCIIRTTEQGLLARGGATMIPLGIQAETCGGAHIDKELLKILINKTEKKGLTWKDDPITRIELKQSPALLRIEDAKIKLSEAISNDGNPVLANDFSHVATPVFLPKGECHPDSDIEEVLTGEDLKRVIHEMWRRHYGRIIATTVNEAKERLMSALKVSLNKIDKVLVAGGSARLPFMKEEIQLVLPTLVDKNDIFIGSDIEEAVAYGIAYECREQAKRDPRLSVSKIAPYILNDLYLGFRKIRKEPVKIPRIKFKDAFLKDGKLLSMPFETEKSVLKYEIEFPFDIPDRIFYLFSDKPFSDHEDVEQMNLSHDVFSVPNIDKLSRKCELHLEINSTGLSKPVFWFRGKGRSSSQHMQKVECPEFYFPDFQVKEGSAYIGFDFGNSNSYLVKFASSPQEITTSEYPKFMVAPMIKDRLRELGLRIEDLRAKGLFSEKRLQEHARNQALEIIFHSNKIEGNPLTKAETEIVLAQDSPNRTSERELEMKNLDKAYHWMIENIDSRFKQPEAFIREINRIIVKSIKQNGGQYRTEEVSLAGVDFRPPQASSVPAFMRQLGEEIKGGGFDRSPLEFATSLHTKLVWIHPFIDGNGRTARLLLNACLLAHHLPVVIVNYADRERYLDCLCESNKGDLSPMVDFFLEGFEQQLEDFTAEVTPTLSAEALLDETVAVPSPLPASETDEIDQAIREVITTEADDPLTTVMREKVLEQNKIRQADYEARKQNFLTISAELKALVESFNYKYIPDGFKMKFREFDSLTFEKYDDINKGRRATKTWFIGLEISGPPSIERVLLFFTRASGRIIQELKANKVSLIVSRFDGSRYQRLDSEPIGLREIGYQDGKLLFLSREGIMPVRGVRQILNSFLSDIIKSYL